MKSRVLIVFLALWLALPVASYAAESTLFAETKALAEKDDAWEQFYLSLDVKYNHLIDYTESLKWTRKAAEQGNAEAQFNLGVRYAQGEGLTRDDAEAVQWFRKAADQGHAKAQFYLGVKYAQGEGLTRDYAEAVKWYRKAADQGLPAAQFMLGGMYAKGRGFIRDYESAYIWFSRAAAQGIEIARKELDLVEKRLTPEQIGRAQKAAASWSPTPGADKKP